MYIKITRKKYKGKIIEHAKIVESYRDGEISRQKVILNLGPINSENDRKKYYEVLSSMKKGKSFIDIEELSVKSAREFGVTYTTNSLLDKYEIDSILNKYLSENDAKFDVLGVVKALIINRVLDPSSDLSACDWIDKHYCEDLNVEEHHLYRALDYLILNKESIEEDIFKILKRKLRLDTSNTFYDLTSSYLEGNACKIAMFGYSRDHRKDRKQVVLGLIMCDGMPIMHEVFTGNTVDKKTLSSMQNSLKKRLGIKRTTIIADAGLMTNPNIEKLELEDFDYILGCHRRNSKISEELLVKQINSEKSQYAEEILTKEEKINETLLFSIDAKKNRKELVSNVISKELQKLFEENDHALSSTATLTLKDELKNTKRKNQWRINDQQNSVTYGLEKRKEKIDIYKERGITKRYILCLDKNTKKIRLEELDGIKDSIENRLKELDARYKKSITSKRGKKITKDSLMTQANKILGKNRRIFSVKFSKGLKFSLKEKEWNYEKKIAGKFLLITNTNIEANKAMKEYKQLQTVENAFDELKNFLGIRPIYHWKPRRVKAHIFVCVLSFLVECMIEKFIKQTARTAINELKTIQVVDIETKTVKKKLVSEISEECEDILKKLKIPIPLMTPIK
jgi:transposase